MQIFKNELKEMREHYIINHLMALNADNDTIAIEVNDLIINVYATSNNQGYINLDSKVKFVMNKRRTGYLVETIIEYKPKDEGEQYSIHLNAYDSLEINKT